ncbi:MAG TPA: PQQ-binding-like beta-propeller repeat protein, partial [Gammaproteobacteria bacterium]|nr:PQQ-binding-like beta-propeller repeat protein [Gammaproteobacteria bacterium]
MRARALAAAVVPISTVLLFACGQRAEDAAPPAAAAPAAPAASPRSATPAEPAAGDWPAYNRTVAGARFSPLAEIDRGNVASLAPVCSYTLPEVSALQTGPIVVAGVMYFTTETRSYAIDAGTCAAKWVVERAVERPSPLGVHRGFAYWNGRLFRGTSDAHVLALDAADGHTLWDHEIDAKAPGVTMPMAPIAANGLVFIGNAGG